jgi:hypothetical protein
MRQAINFYFYKLSVREAWRGGKAEFLGLYSYDMYELLAWEEERIKEDERQAKENNGKSHRFPEEIPDHPQTLAEFNELTGREPDE